jgi:hypothetical protein
MATKHRRLRSYPQGSVRASNMPSSQESTMYKVGLLGLLGIATLGIAIFQRFQIFA